MGLKYISASNIYIRIVNTSHIPWFLLFLSVKRKMLLIHPFSVTWWPFKRSTKQLWCPQTKSRQSTDWTSWAFSDSNFFISSWLRQPWMWKPRCQMWTRWRTEAASAMLPPCLGSGVGSATRGAEYALSHFGQMSHFVAFGWNVAIYAFCWAQNVCSQAPKTILHPSLQQQEADSEGRQLRTTCTAFESISAGPAHQYVSQSHQDHWSRSQQCEV